MPTTTYTRSHGKCLTYTISYDQNEYFIERDGKLKRSMPDAIVGGIVPSEATPELMLRTAIADIEALINMEE